MKRTFAITCLLTWVAITVMAQNALGPCLVREGVVWHYAYAVFETSPDSAIVDSTLTIVDQKMQFMGDTIVCGINYKKCYRYATDRLTPHDSPVALAREQGGKVYFAPVQQSDTCERPFMTLPGTFQELTHECLVYDFDNVQAFVENLDTCYKSQVDTIFVSEITEAQLGDMVVETYILNIGDARYVQGVGADGLLAGFLDKPFSQRSASLRQGVLGLMMLTDLEGNILYRGSYFQTEAALPCDLNQDGLVDIADINIIINVMLGYDVPIGHQGHDTAPPLYHKWQFDVTGDRVVDISDVGAVINALLGR